MLKLNLTTYKLAPGHQGLGDLWAATSYILKQSVKLNETIKISNSTNLQRKTMMWVKPHLDHSGNFIFIPNNTGLSLNYCAVFSEKFLKTKKRWDGGSSNIVAYQFDGRHWASEKNPPRSHQNYFLKQCRKLNLIPINLGGEKSLKLIIDTLSKAKAFVGCVSGISKVAISMGVPIYIVTYRLSQDKVNFIKRCQYKCADDLVILKNLYQVINYININQKSPKIFEQI